MAIKKSSNSSLLLYGKNILVSGAATEYAEPIVMSLAAEGANLILTDKEKTILNDLTTRINKKYGLNSSSIELDLSHDRDQPYQHVSRSIIANDIKHLDGLVTLGYGQAVASTTMNFPTPLWKDNIQHNLDGIFILVKNLLPFLLSAKNPHIVFSLINNDQVVDDSHNLAQRVASYALEGFTMLLAEEMQTSHLSICGIKLDADFYQGETNKATLNKRSSVATELPRILATANKSYNGRILTPNT